VRGRLPVRKVVSELTLKFCFLFTTLGFYLAGLFSVENTRFRRFTRIYHSDAKFLQAGCPSRRPANRVSLTVANSTNFPTFARIALPNFHTLHKLYVPVVRQKMTE